MRATTAVLLLLPLLASACAAPAPELRPDDADFAFVDLGFQG